MKTSVFLTFGIITINLFIVLMMFGDLKAAFLLIGEFPFSFLLGIIGLYFCGSYIAKWMNDLIKDFREFAIIIGIIGLFLILISGIFIGSSIGFLIAIPDLNHEYTIRKAFEDFYFNPFLLILLFGFIPTAITGAFLGYLLKMNVK